MVKLTCLPPGTRRERRQDRDLSVVTPSEVNLLTSWDQEGEEAGPGPECRKQGGMLPAGSLPDTAFYTAWDHLPRE